MISIGQPINDEYLFSGPADTSKPVNDGPTPKKKLDDNERKVAFRKEFCEHLRKVTYEVTMICKHISMLQQNDRNGDSFNSSF